MAEPIRRDLRLPLYEQLRQALLADIVERRLKAGARLESEAELCARFGVSRTVVRQALGELTQRGVLSRIQGKGTFVSEPKLREHFLHTAGGFFHDLASRGHRISSKVIDCREAVPEPTVANALELVDQRVVLLERLRYVDDEALVFTRAHLPTLLAEDLVGQLQRADLGKVSLYTILEERCGIQIVSAKRTLEAVSADRRVAGHLGIRTGAPLLLLRSVARDAAGRAVEYFEAWHRGDRTLFEVSVDGRQPG